MPDGLSETPDNLSETIRPFVLTLVGMDFLLYLCTSNFKLAMNMETYKNMIDRTTVKNESLGLMAFIIICSMMVIGLSSCM